MKQTIKLLLAVAAILGFATSCSDIPAPYDLIGQITGGTSKSLPYKNTSLNTGWHIIADSEYSPWSQGASYTQATGYQDWDGTGTKSNKEVTGILLSPAFNTHCESGKVKIKFDQTIRYESRVADWKNYHKIYVSSNFNGDPDTFTDADWVELNYVPVASTTNDWTLYSSGDIQLPEEMANQDAVYIAFYFHAPADNSTTWELQNFQIMEGEANGDAPTDGTGGETGGDKVEPAGDGTLENPYNVAMANKVCSALESGQTTGRVYVKGIVTSIKEVSAQFGNATFYMADVAGGKETFYVYRALGLDNKNVTDENFIKVGDEVIICGTLTNYNGTYETSQKQAYVYAVNGAGGNGGNTDQNTGESKGNGTVDAPYNVPGIIAYTSKLAADTESSPVYFKGIVCSVKEISTSYGNGTFYISEDGTTNGAQFYVFRCMDLGNKKFTDANAVKVGDEVVIYGPVVNYKGNTPETAGNKAYIYSINGNATPGTNDGGQTPDTPTTPGSSEGISISGATITLTNPSYAASTPATNTSIIDLDTYGWANAQEVTDAPSADGMFNAMFSTGTGSTSPKFYAATHGVRMYANNTLELSGNLPIASVVIECDSYQGTDYVGNPGMSLAFEGTHVKLTNTNSTNSGGVQLRAKKITIYYVDRTRSAIHARK